MDGPAVDQTLGTEPTPAGTSRDRTERVPPGTGWSVSRVHAPNPCPWVLQAEARAPIAPEVSFSWGDASAAVGRGQVVPGPSSLCS